MASTTLFKVYMPPIHQVTMPRHFNRMSGLKPVHSIKHVVDLQGALAVGVNAIVAIQTTVDAPVLANTTEVETGSIQNSFFLKVEIVATSSAALSNAYMILMKDPGGGQTQPNPNAVGSFDQKALVIHQEMVMLQKQTGSNPRTLFVGVIKVPKIYRRNRPEDRWLVILRTPGITADYCIQAIYKEYR